MAVTNKTKRTYALSAPLVAAFEAAVPSGDRSRMIENLIEGALEERRRAELRAATEAMCLDMAEVWLEEAEAYRHADAEVLGLDRT